MHNGILDPDPGHATAPKQFEKQSCASHLLKGGRLVQWWAHGSVGVSQGAEVQDVSGQGTGWQPLLLCSSSHGLSESYYD